MLAAHYNAACPVRSPTPKVSCAPPPWPGAARSERRPAATPLGTMEPAPQSAVVAPDIVLVPLAAFERAGHRIGYGAGHYDRTLTELRALKPIVAIGLAFAVQEIETIPALPHDVRLDYVLTED